MATVLQDEEQKDQELATQQGEELVSGGAQAPTTGGGAMSAPANAPKRQGSGRHVNLQKYLQANQGAGQQLGSGIVQRSQEQAQKGQTESQKQAEGIRQTLEGERQRLGQAQGFQQQLQQQGGAQQLAQQNLDQFTQLRTGQNQAGQLQQQAGQLYQQAGQGVQGLQNRADQAGTEAGRFQLLQQAYGTPNYNMGQRRLDQLLLQAGGSGRGIQNQLQQQATQAQQGLAGYQQEFDPAISGIGTQAQDISSQLQGFLQQGAGEGIEDTLQQRGIEDIEQYLQQAQTGRQADIGAARSALQQASETGKFTPEQIAATGIDPNQVMFGLSGELGQFLSPERQVNLSQVTSAEEAARYNALRQLAGQQEGGLAFDESQFGQEVDGGLLRFRPDLQKELSRRESAFQGAVDPNISRIKESEQLAQYLAGVDPNDVFKHRRMTPQGWQGATLQQLLAPSGINLSSYMSGIDPSRQISDRAMYQGMLGILGNNVTGARNLARQNVMQQAEQRGAFDTLGGANADKMAALQQLIDRYGS